MQPHATHDTFWRVVERIEQYFDTAADALDDDALFTAGYLQGHFAVVVSRLQDAPTRAETLHGAMVENLNAAFAAGELDATDQEQVLRLWDTIFTDSNQFGA